MSSAKLTDDGLDACYQMTETAPRARALPSLGMLFRGTAYGVLIAGALGLGLLAMQPGGLAVDELFGSQLMIPGRPEGACCSQLKLEIPNSAPSSEPSPPAQEENLGQFAGEEAPATSTTDL